MDLPETATLKKQADGSILATDVIQTEGHPKSSTTRAPIAVIEPAWALDANGVPVETRYEVKGNTIQQIVEINDDTAFPVVADPKVTRPWWGIRVRFSKKETNKIAFTAGGCAAVAVAIPDPTASKLVAATCGVLAAYAAYVYNNGKCLQFNWRWVGGGNPSSYKC